MLRFRTLLALRRTSLVAVNRMRGNVGMNVRLISMETPHDGNVAKEVQRRSPDEPRLDSQLSKGDLSERQILPDSIAGVDTQIVEVAESIKLVQKQIIGVGSQIEATKVELSKANLPNEKKEILVMALKNLMDKEKRLMDKEGRLMDEKKFLADEKKFLVDKEGRLMNKGKILFEEKKDHQKHSDGWWEWWKSNLNILLAGGVSIVAVISGLATFNKETDKLLEDIYNILSSSLANAKVSYVNSPNYVTRPAIESKILNVYDNKYLEKGAYYIVYGVKGAGKTSAVMHVLGNKSGVVMVRISQKDTDVTIMKSIFTKCGVTLNEVADVDKVVDSMRDATVKRNGHPITIVFEVERGSSASEVLSTVKHISKDFALVANVLIVLSEANAVLGFGEDKRQKVIFVDEMTREEAEQFVKKRAPNISSKDFNKFADLCGTIPLVLHDFCDDFLEGLTVDESIANVVDSARGDLLAFPHKPILSALKNSPNGVRADDFNNVEDKGISLSSPKLVAPAMKISGAIYYDFKARRYKLFSKAHETALKNYDPSEIPKISK